MSSPPNRELYNSRIIDTYLRLLKKSYPQVQIPVLLDYSGMEPCQIVDPGHWFSQEQVDRFYEKLVELCKNPSIAREAGQYAASPDALGPFRHYLLGMLGPANAFALIGKAASRLTRSASYTSRRLGSRKTEITVRPHPSVEEKEFQCVNRLGWFEAAVNLFGRKTENIEHPQCLFRGDPVCRYVISWNELPATFWKKARNFGIAGIPLLLTASFAFSIPLSPLPLLLGGGLVLLLLLLFAEIEDKIRLKIHVDRINKEAENTLNKISMNYDNALLTDEIGRAISEETRLQSVLDRVVEKISQRTTFDRVMIFLLNREKTRLELSAKCGLSDNGQDLLQDLSLPIDPSRLGSPVIRAFRERKSVLVEDPYAMKDAFSPEGFHLIEQLRAESFLCCPIVCNGESLGFLAADKKSGNNPLLQSDLSLMDGIAAYIGIALRNADLLEDMKGQLKQLQEKDDELARHRENLEEQVKVRTIQLQEALKAAEEANNAKSEFLAKMSHEIRTPMTVFMGVVEHLLEIDSDPERHDLLEMADQSAQRLCSLIDDILDLSRIEANRMEVEERAFDLRGCVGRAVNLFLLSAREKNLRLEIEVAPDVPDQVLGDPNKLGQVLINLVGNALKFTPEGKVIVSLQTRGDVLEFSVADSGIGIPQEKQHLLFQRFNQTDNSFHRKYGGSGLGLTISKALVELMGGQIDVFSRHGEGSVFTFTFPLKTVSENQSAAPAEIRPEEPAKENLPARILFAEDDPMVQEMVKNILNRGGWQPETVENGREALEKWTKGNFDLILMDVQMPEMNGIEATREIRKREAEDGMKRTCIIGLTAHAGCEIEEECRTSGMNQVLKKPVKKKDLLSAIENCL